jgi:hypothetical protein
MVVEPAPSASATTGAPRRPLAGPYLWLGFAGSLIIAVTSPLWRLAGRTWRLTLPGVPHDGERPFSVIALVVGVALLSISWIALVRRAERSELSERQRTRAVMVTALLWFVPVLLGPPLLSSDIYSYAAQGEMVNQGLDPTSQGMYKLRFGFLAHVDPAWRNSTGNPYGPVQMGASALAVSVAGHDFNRTIWLLRLLSVAGLLLSVWGIQEIARHYGVSPPAAVAIGIANPIAVIHLVGGGHNDALLIGLLCTGIALALRGRWTAGVVVMALATAVKLPAAAAILYLAWARPGAGVAVRARIREVVRAGALAGAVITVVGAMVGIGFGWITAITNSGTTTDTLSLSTRLGFVTNQLLGFVGHPMQDATWIDLFRFVGVVAAGYLCVRMLWRVERFGAVQAAGIALLVVVLLGPVVWPWYLTPAFVLLGATTTRWRPPVLVLCAAFAFEVLPLDLSSKPVFDQQNLQSVELLIIIGVVAGAATIISEYKRAQRLQRANGYTPSRAMPSP